jgi:hypothetical protein
VSKRLVVIYEDSALDFPRAVHEFVLRCAELPAAVVVDAEFADGYQKFRATLQRVLKDTKDLRGVVVVGDADQLHKLLGREPIQTDDDVKLARDAFFQHVTKDVETASLPIHTVALRWNAESIAMAAVELILARHQTTELLFKSCTPDPRTAILDRF